MRFVKLDLRVRIPRQADDVGIVFPKHLPKLEVLLYVDVYVRVLPFVESTGALHCAFHLTPVGRENSGN
jgi:hypothetical protein